MSECKRSDTGHLSAAGYYVFNGGVKIGGQHLVHRWTYQTHHKVQLTSDQLVLHKCNNPWCVEITHLYLGTHKDNGRDKREAGTVKGDKNPNSLYRYHGKNKDELS